MTHRETEVEHNRSSETTASVCVCVCVCKRERERKDCIIIHPLIEFGVGVWVLSGQISLGLFSLSPSARRLIRED